ncbi:MAG: Gfo/Idh/MocA family oxidoreductase [Chthonomonas sp.]|nr:Gfo/Idh/MocA family oxidoreductase [Chthonomonas sp.]
MKVAILGVAHVHVHAYLHHLGSNLHGIYDCDPRIGMPLAEKYNVPFFDNPEALVAESEAAVICSETVHHETLIALCVQANVPILCEKPIAMDRASGERINQMVNGHPFMAALPCRFSPMWSRILQRVQAGEIGEILSITATNHGKCPGGWFVEKELGGGTILDHTVHCADLINQLGLGTPVGVKTHANNLFQAKGVEDAAMSTYDLPNGKFVTLDSSWSRPAAYPVWGDLTLTIVGDKGVIEADLYAQSIGVTDDRPRGAGYGSNLELALIEDFLGGAPYKTSLEDGLRADSWAWLAIESLTASSNV